MERITLRKLRITLFLPLTELKHKWVRKDLIDENNIVIILNNTHKS